MKQTQYKKAVKQSQLEKVKQLKSTIDWISSYLCGPSASDVHEHKACDPPERHSEESNESTSLFHSRDSLPAAIYAQWFEEPEVRDVIYGLDPDCESPHLFVSQARGGYSPRTLRVVQWLYRHWGYFSEREIRHRAAHFSYMKAQRRCAHPQFWAVFDLQHEHDSFLVELQILAVHLWIIKTRMDRFESRRVRSQLSYETFRIMFTELGVRFEKHISGSRSRWESD